MNYSPYQGVKEFYVLLNAEADRTLPLSPTSIFTICGAFLVLKKGWWWKR